MLPEIFLEEESHDKKIFEFGFYAEDIKLTFKTQEIYGESIVSKGDATTSTIVQKSTIFYI
jgi:hypothetical protein